MRIFIKNLKETRDGIRCDRIGIYGNPFDLADTNNDLLRDKVCDAYDDFFYRIVSQPSCKVEEILSAVSALYNVNISSTWKNFSRLKKLLKLLNNWFVRQQMRIRREPREKFAFYVGVNLSVVTPKQYETI